MKKYFFYFFWQLFLFLFLTSAPSAYPQVSEINSIGSFEQDLPSYWTKGNEPSGTTLSWATDEFRSMGSSLKIEKTGTGDSASWISENMVDLWSERHFANVDIKLGAYVKTMNVNTNPANEDEMWWISYSFWDSAGALIGETNLPIDQSTATSSGWIADTNGIGETILPENAWTTIIKFVAGKNATGTVWADDFIFVGRGGAWAGQDWNTQLGVPTGWYYWMPPIGGNDGELNAGFENTIITNEDAYDGDYSLKYDLPTNRAVKDGFISTRRFAATDIVPGDVLRISIWVKGMNLYPDSAAAAGEQWSIALSALYHSALGNNEGFKDYANSNQIPLVFPNATSFDWTQFYITDTIPEPPQGQELKSISIRLHALTRFAGTVWMDDLEVIKETPTGVDDKFTPYTFDLSQNFPNPFNPSTTINYSIPQYSNVSLVIYNILGSKIRTLVNNSQAQGNYSVVWNGKDDFGNSVSSGIYFYALKAGDISFVKKMILMK